MASPETRSVLACSVAGGGWLIRFDGGGAKWVDTTACWAAAPEESAWVAALGRSLLLSPGEQEGVLPAEEVRWLLAEPRRLACLIDLIAASEELGRVLSTPLRVTLSDTGEVRWRFAAPWRSACEPVAMLLRFRWPMASAASETAGLASQPPQDGGAGDTGDGKGKRCGAPVAAVLLRGLGEVGVGDAHAPAQLPVDACLPPGEPLDRNSRR